MQIEITIFDSAGNVVERSVSETRGATQQEIDDMVSMIHAGTPAWLAAQIATLATDYSR